MRRLLNWFRLTSLEGDLDRELKYHIERRVSDLMQSGLTETEAKRRAALEIGGVTQVREEVRDIWLMRWLREFLYDLRFSARSLLRSPSFTATVVLSFALGIGATTAIYSLVDQVILHALPVRDPQQLVLIDWKGDSVFGAFGTYNLMSHALCRDLQQQERFFDGVLCRAAIRVNLSTGAEHRPTAAEIVSGNYFSVLGVGALMGRVLTNEDDGAPGASPVVVLSHDFWKAQLGGAADVVGREVLVNRRPMTVIGVAAAEFRGIDVGEVPALWIPVSMAGQMLPHYDPVRDRRTQWMQILGRLRPNVDLAGARAGLQPWFKARLEEEARSAEFPKITAERRQRFLSSILQLTPAPQGHSPLRRTLAQPLWVLFAATGVLLGLACLNVASLFLARGSARDREISTRLALGASRGRIARQLLADSVLLSLAGGLLGLVLAPLVMRTLIAFLPSSAAVSALHTAISGRLLLFGILVSAATGLVTGLAPAVRASGGAPISRLKERGATTAGGLRLRRIIVTAQVAFTLILVIGAALFVRTLAALLDKGPGFATSSLITFGIDPVRSGYSPQDANRLIRGVYQQLRASPVTQAAALARNALLTGGTWNDPLTIQDGQRTITDREVHLNAITPGFFTTLGARIVAGRGFDERDTRTVAEGGHRVAIVNEAFVKRYMGGRSPLGARIGEGSGLDVKADTEIVGVVSNISYRGIRQDWEQAYFPIVSDKFYEAGAFYVRIHGSSDAAASTVRSILHSADPTLPLNGFRTVDEQVRRALSTERMLATLSAGFGTVALLLSLVGLYGVMAFVVTQRTREIGIRLALGATRAGAVWLVLRGALAIVGAGIAIALPCVWMLGGLVQAQLYGVQATDPATIIAATVVLGSAALAAALIPARRASAVSPTEALRFE